jgi:CrcB protein
VGTGLREAIALANPASDGGFPAAVYLINVIGAFALGLLLEVLARRGPDSGRRRSVRLLLGTGVLGGFTTYSAFAVDAAALLGESLAVALMYMAATLIVGLLASAGGIVAGHVLERRTDPSAR